MQHINVPCFILLSSYFCPDIHSSASTHALFIPLHISSHHHLSSSPLLALCLPPASAGPPCLHDLLHTPPLYPSCFKSRRGDPQGGCAEPAILVSCDALPGGHWQSWLLFLLTSVFCFSFPCHTACLMCSDVQHFLKMD